jgi:Ala-tRNA(Pro) deacylase
MAICPRLAELFARNRATFEVLSHPKAFTAWEIAERFHVPATRVAKVHVVRDRDAAYLMAVVPRTESIDFETLARVTGRRGLSIVPESALGRRFPDCEPGAIPPFGNLYHMPIWVDACLSQADIYFQAGSHCELVRMSYDEFDRMAEPLSGDFCLHAAHALR